MTDTFKAGIEAAAEKLADAMWQLLDDMGDGHTVCEQAKQDAI